jgi:hypothetical protein
MTPLNPIPPTPSSDVDDRPAVKLTKDEFGANYKTLTGDDCPWDLASSFRKALYNRKYDALLKEHLKKLGIAGSGCAAPLLTPLNPAQTVPVAMLQVDQTIAVVSTGGADGTGAAGLGCADTGVTSVAHAQPAPAPPKPTVEERTAHIKNCSDRTQQCPKCIDIWQAIFKTSSSDGEGVQLYQALVRNKPEWLVAHKSDKAGGTVSVLCHGFCHARPNPGKRLFAQHHD